MTGKDSAPDHEVPLAHVSRFGGVSRLYGENGQQRIHQAHVCIIGVGGVGCWTAEALTRSGVGRVTLIDADDLCVSNTNRQLHAVEGSYGQAKVEVMAERMRTINPEIQVEARQEFFTPRSAEALLAIDFDYIVDAIDRVPHKCLLLKRCRERKIPVITSGSAGGRIDATRIRVVDLTRATYDPLLARVRKTLRQKHGFPRNPKKKFHIACATSDEPVIQPENRVCDVLENRGAYRLDCDTGYGTSAFVVGTFGLVLAGHVVTQIARSELA